VLAVQHVASCRHRASGPGGAEGIRPRSPHCCLLLSVLLAAHHPPPHTHTQTQVDTLDEAIQLVNANPYGNGTALFTDSGSAARQFQHDVQVRGPGGGGVSTRPPVCLPTL
jgi:hypothetical protein